MEVNRLAYSEDSIEPFQLHYPPYKRSKSIHT